MRANSKPGIVLVMYTIILYSFLELVRAVFENKNWNRRIYKEVYIKCVVWLVPAILIHFNFSNDMFIKKKRCVFIKQKCWIAVPMMLLLAIYIIINEYLVNGKLEINESLESTP